MNSLRIFDTTLRDGELSPDFGPRIDERQQIAAALDAAGVDVIEVVGSYESDARLEESRIVASTIERATICCLAQLTENDILRARQFFDGIARSRLHLYLDAKRIRALQADPGLESEIFAMMKSMIGEACEHFTEVEFSPQDATRTDSEVLAKIVSAGLDAGAGIISISDTAGTAAPAEIDNCFAVLRERVPNLDTATLSLHAHNHLGRAEENVFAAIGAGVLQIEGTICGVGPAGGNTDLLGVLRSAAIDESLEARIAHIDLEKLEELASLPRFQAGADRSAR